MDPRIAYALGSALLFGIGLPIAKITVNNFGLDPKIFIIINGFCSTLVGLVALNLSNQQTYSRLSLIPIILAFTAGLIMNTSYLLSNLSLSFKGGAIAITYTITAGATLITILFGLIFLDESKNIAVIKLLAGTLMTFIGIYLAITSINSN